MHWIMLVVAICLEVFATSMLKTSEGFSRFWPTVGVLLGYAASFTLLAQVVKVVPLSITYAIWSGAGTLLVVGIGVAVYRERLSLLQVIGVLLTVAGVVLLNLGGTRHDGTAAPSAESGNSGLSSEQFSE